jgi:hypothetical protein
MEIYSKQHIMKNVLLGLMLFFSIASFAQVGVGTTTPVTSAMLEVKSTTKGFLPPRMTTAQRDAISSPAEGLMVYQTDAPIGYYFRKGGVWLCLATSTCSYSIGQNVPELGGFIFYLDASGCHGLVCATTDQSTGIRWHNGVNWPTNSIESGNGLGKGNTQSIIKFQGTGSYAAKSCTNYTGGGFTDWYLPSRYELNLMWLNVGQGATNVGGFSSNSDYWSSSEYIDDFSLAWSQTFTSGNQSNQGWMFKNSLNHVRAIRAF